MIDITKQNNLFEQLQDSSHLNDCLLKTSWENLDISFKQEIVKLTKWEPLSESNEKFYIAQLYKTFLDANSKLPFHLSLLKELHNNENDHSRILCKILQYSPKDDKSYPWAIDFVKRFADEEIAIAWQNSNKPLNIVFNRDFIDLAIWKQGVAGVIIENKIKDAEDQDKQLEDYTTKMIENTRKYNCKKPYAIYLTWNGIKKISDISLTEKAKQNLSEDPKTCDLKRFFNRNYVYDILPWLKEVVLPQTFHKERIMISALEQYIDYLETRASLRPEDIAKNEMIYQKIQNLY